MDNAWCYKLASNSPLLGRWTTILVSRHHPHASGTQAYCFIIDNVCDTLYSLVLFALLLVDIGIKWVGFYGYSYMFMNKISMSQTHLYNIPYQKLPDFYNNQSLQRTFGYSSA